ncbi:MAG: hypothetical protein IPN34_15915 [Planctomycetes bacterium]|nr:hypothetical protein [Planctomycetota bacterium]
MALLRSLLSIALLLVSGCGTSEDVEEPLAQPDPLLGEVESREEIGELVYAPGRTLPRPGFRHRDGDFAGTFRDAAGNELALSVGADGAAQGQLGLADVMQVEGRVDGARLVAQATRGSESLELRGTWSDENLLLSCGELELVLRRWAQPQSFDLGAPVLDPERRWTLAIYLGGDNDLEESAIDDLYEMERALPERGVEVLVLLDRAEGFDERRGDWKDTRILRVRRGEEASEVLAAPGELDTNYPQALAGFAVAAFQKFPAQRYGLIVWDHGGGWGGVVVDEDAKAHGRGGMLTPMELRSALRSIQLSTPLPRLDLLAFDACLMAQLENGLLCEDFAQILVASEANVAATGFPYGRCLEALGDAALDPAEIARAWVAAFGQASDAEHEGEATLSAIDTSALPRVARVLDEAAAALLPRVAEDWAPLLRALFYAECYEPRRKRLYEHAHSSVDLGDLARRFANELAAPPAELAHLAEAIDAAVLASHGGASRVSSRGLAIYGPRLAAQQRERYAQTPLGAGNRFRALLAELHARALSESAAAAISEVRCVRFDGAPQTLVTPGAADGLAFRVTGRALAQVDLHQYERDEREQGWFLLRQSAVVDPTWPQRYSEATADEADRVLPRFRDGENELHAELTGFGWQISNGEEQRRATIDERALSLTQPLSVRGRALVHPEKAAEQELEVEIEFSRPLWRAQCVRVARETREDDPVSRLVKLEPGSSVKLLRVVRRDSGALEESWSEPLAWKGGFELVLAVDAPGRQHIEVAVTDLAGRETRATTEIEVGVNAELAAFADGWKDFDPAVLKGTWPQHVFVGDGRTQKTPLSATFEGAVAELPGFLSVRSAGTKDGETLELEQLWKIELRGVPSLRIVTLSPDQRHQCWYGPAYLGVRDRRLVVGMKVLNVPGTIWEWQRSRLEGLRLPETPKRDGPR